MARALDVQVLEKKLKLSNKKFDCTSEPASVLSKRTSSTSRLNFYYDSLFKDTKLQAIQWKFVFFPSRPPYKRRRGLKNAPELVTRTTTSSILLRPTSLKSITRTVMML
jgi:hypothetical protein